MSDRRAVSAGHLGASSVAAANEPWRVAVGGNRVQSMTIEQIAQAFHAGQLTVRTPLWPPGTSGWQALGNFEQFQLDPAYAGVANGQLSQFDEAEDDPTRMWTGSAELELDGMQQYMPEPPPPPARPSSQTGPRQVSSRAPRPQAVSSQPVRYPAAPPAPSMPAKRASRGNGLMLIAGLVGLVGLGSAVLAARSNWSLIAPSRESAPQTSQGPGADPGAPVEAPSAQQATTNVATAVEANGAQLAKYEDTSASAFVAGAEGDEAAKDDAQKDPQEVDEAASGEPVKAASDKPRAEEPASSTRPKTTAKAASRRTVAPAPKARPKPEPRAAEAKSEPKAEPQEKAPAASASVNEAAAAALGTSATLASSCRPRGGPSGPGKARIIYSNDGDVQSVEILTAKFRDTLTGSCVRMVFRRAKIPAFKGEPPTFIKSFTIPDE